MHLTATTSVYRQDIPSCFERGSVVALLCQRVSKLTNSPQRDRVPVAQSAPLGVQDFPSHLDRGYVVLLHCQGVRELALGDEGAVVLGSTNASSQGYTLLLQAPTEQATPGREHQQETAQCDQLDTEQWFHQCC
jgi:hypothetical protein